MENVLYLGATEQTLSAVCPPLEMRLSYADCGRVERTVDGTAIPGGGRANVATVTLIWEELPPADAETIVQAVSNGFFWMRYADPLSGEMRAAAFCALQREADALLVRGGSAYLRRFTLRAAER